MYKLILFALFLSGCASNEKKVVNKEDNPIEKTEVRFVDTFSNAPLTKEEIHRIFDSTDKANAKRDSIALAKSLIEFPPTQHELETFAKVKKANSAVRFLSQYFITGSTASQLRKVQGRPDDIIKTEDYTEVWLYGNCEVTVYNTIVSKIENESGCLNYIDAKVCLDSRYPEIREIIKEVVRIESMNIRY